MPCWCEYEEVFHEGRAGGVLRSVFREIRYEGEVEEVEEEFEAASLSLAFVFLLEGTCERVLAT